MSKPKLDWLMLFNTIKYKHDDKVGKIENLEARIESLEMLVSKLLDLQVHSPRGSQLSRDDIYKIIR